MTADRMLAGLSVVAVCAASIAVSAAPAAATGCSGALRYASSSNTVYLTGGTWTPTLVQQTCPSAPLRLVEAASHTWELSADLVLQSGAELDLHGSADGGDVDTLRLRSLATSA